MTKTILSKEEVKIQMKDFGFELHSTNGDETILNFSNLKPEIGGIALHCKLTFKHNEWHAALSYPQLKMLMSINCAEISFPHPGFNDFIAAMNHYAAVCNWYPPL